MYLVYVCKLSAHIKQQNVEIASSYKIIITASRSDSFNALYIDSIFSSLTFD